jgi:hypothetical protein
MTKVFGGPYNGTYVLAVTIFSLGIIRDLMYGFPLAHHPSSLLFASILCPLATPLLLPFYKAFRAKADL